ncbi:MAG TPA: hypothetical protein VF903_13015, partial [Nitrospirota bacterium]
VIQVLGAAALAVLYPIESPFYTVGIMLFDAGALVSAVYLFARMRLVKKCIVGSVAAGLALQAAGALYAPEQYAGSVIIAGIGFVCAGAAGMAGKEARSSGSSEGWPLIAGFSVVVLGNLIGKENRVFNSLGFSVIFLLLLSLTGRKLRRKLLT